MLIKTNLGCAVVVAQLAELSLTTTEVHGLNSICDNFIKNKGLLTPFGTTKIK